MENTKTIFDVFLTPPWDQKMEKVLLEEFRKGIVEEGEYSDTSIKWQEGNVLEFVECNPEYSTIDKISCKCWLTKEGIIHAQVCAGFYLEFMPPMVLHHPKECGKQVARMTIDIFEMEIDRKEDYLAQINYDH